MNSYAGFLRAAPQAEDVEDDDAESTIIATRSELEAIATKKQASPYIAVVNGKGAGKIHKVIGEMTIGRGRTAAIILDEDGVSRHHAKVQIAPDGGVELSDLGSTNGTFINGERVVRRVLADGDKIQIGTGSLLRFSLQDAADVARHQDLYESATRDGLTKVFNKKTFTEALARELSFAIRHKRPVSLLMLDIDHFKKVNDTHGHPAGDAILRHFARMLGECLRAEDVLARYGGEEFAVILRDIPEKHAVMCAERLRQRVADSAFLFQGKPIAVTTSVGVATYTGEGDIEDNELVAAADQRLYEAKRAGRNRVVSSKSRG